MVSLGLILNTTYPRSCTKSRCFGDLPVPDRCLLAQVEVLKR